MLIWKAALALLVCLTAAGPALAYTLPAPEFLGQFFALAAWAFVALSSVLLYPVYALTRWWRGTPAPKPEAPPAPATSPDAPTNAQG